MKKLFTLIAMTLFAVGMNAQGDSKKLVKMEGYNLYESVYENGANVSHLLDEPTLSGSDRFFYDSKNQNCMEISNTGYYRYNYNADGTVASREQWNVLNGVFYKSNEMVYEYDADKNITKTTSTNYDSTGQATYTSSSLFEDYENGHYKVMKNTNAEGGVTYEVHYELTFNEAKQITSSVQLTGDNFANKGMGTFYTYEDGKLVSEKQAYYMATAGEGHEWDNVIGTTNYAYNTDGSIKTRTVVSDSRYGHSEIEWRYTYSELNAELTPTNVKCDATVGGNKVKVTWDAVVGATGYVVIYDNVIAEVDKNEFTTPVLADGEHHVSVLAVVNGEKNMSDIVKVSVKDEGNVPMQNFKVLGAQKVEVESNGYVSYYYDLNMSWDVPEGASPITNYKVYVDNGGTYYPSVSYTQGLTEVQDSYNTVNSWVTNNGFLWTTFEETTYDSDTYQTISLGKGPDCKIWICAIYATGESQKSNVVEVNVYNLANDTESVESMKTSDSNVSAQVFNLAGLRVAKTNGRQIVIVKQGDMVKKVIK